MAFADGRRSISMIIPLAIFFALQWYLVRGVAE
jgi:hypothetical protein